jgi:hypothetical protein
MLHRAGPYQCSVITYQTSDTVITCETPPGDAGSYEVVVKINHQLTASRCCFEYTPSATPSELQQ